MQVCYSLTSSVMKEIDVQGRTRYSMMIGNTTLRRHITLAHDNVQPALPASPVLTLIAQMAVRLDSLVLEDYGESVADRTTPAASLITPYIPPELIFEFFNHIDTSSHTGRSTISSCRAVCRDWSRLLHPLAFQDAVISFTNEPEIGFGVDYDTWCSTTTTSLERYILPLAQAHDSLAVKRLTLKACVTKGGLILPNRTVLPVCVLRSLIEQLPSLEQLDLYNLTLYSCRGTQSCTRGLEWRPVARPLKRLCLHGADVLDGGERRNGLEMGSCCSALAFIQSQSPDLLHLTKTDIAQTWRLPESKVPMPLRSLEYIDSPILSRFERFIGLEKIHVGQLKTSDLPSLKRIISQEIDTLRSIVINTRVSGAYIASWNVLVLTMF